MIDYSKTKLRGRVVIRTDIWSRREWRRQIDGFASRDEAIEWVREKFFVGKETVHSDGSIVFRVDNGDTEVLVQEYGKLVLEPQARKDLDARLKKFWDNAKARGENYEYYTPESNGSRHWTERFDAA